MEKEKTTNAKRPLPTLHEFVANNGAPPEGDLMPQIKPITLKVLREQAKRLGITAESAGCPVEELIGRARDTDDPIAYLTVHAPDPPMDDEGEEEATAETAVDPPTIYAREPVQDVTIEVPLSTAPFLGSYVPRHVDVQALTAGQGEVLRRLFEGLDASGVRLVNGRRMISKADAVRWVLDEIGKALDGKGEGGRGKGEG